MATNIQYLRNRNTGEHHKVFVIDDERLSGEQCNLDDAEDLESVTLEAAQSAVAAGGSWCGHCCSDDHD